MTALEITDVTPRVQFAAGAAQTLFTVPFEFFEDIDLVVDVDNVVQTLNTDYTVTGAGLTGGGSITFTPAPAAAAVVTIFRDLGFDRSTAYQNNGALPAQVLERDFDKTVAMLQQNERDLARTLRLTQNDLGVSDDLVLPTKAGRLDQLLAFDSQGKITVLPKATEAIGTAEPFLATTAEESGASVTPIVFKFREKRARRYLTPNDPGQATANSTALKALLDPTTTGFEGRFIFDGNDDIYHFNDVIPIREGIRFELEGNKLKFTKTYAAPDDFTGFIYAVKDFVCRNGEIEIDYDGTAGSGAGHAIKLGNRSTAGAHFQPVFDASLPEPWGNILLSNLKIKTNNPSTGVIELLGGLRDVDIKDVRIDGGGVATRGITYEFGFATDNVDPTLRETSHLNNWNIKNVRIENLNTTTSIALRIAGAYNVSVDGLYVNGGFEGINATPGESFFFRPWVGVDEAGAKRNIHLKNIVLQGLNGTGMVLNGASAIGGYLSAHIPALTNNELTDLYDVVVENFAILASAKVGITTSAGKFVLRDGYIKGASFALQMTDECTQFLIDNVTALDGTSTIAFRLNFGSPIFSPERKKTGIIRNCFIAGTGGDAIVIDHAESVTVENNRFGYEVAHDGKAETTQTGAILIEADAHVIARDNYVAGSAGSLMYKSIGAAKGVLINPRGLRTAGAAWRSEYRSIGSKSLNAAITLQVGVDDRIIRSTAALTANRVTTLSTTDAIEGDTFRIVHTGGGAFTLDVGPGLKIIPASTNAFVDAMFDGTAWRLTGFSVL